MIKYFQTPNKHHLYLSIFRVFIAVVIIFKVAMWASVASIMFGTNSFIVRRTDPLFLFFNIHVNSLAYHYKAILMAMLCAAFFSLFGIFKNLSLFFLFGTLEIIQRLNPLILNGGDNLLKFLLLYLSFADSFQYLTLFKTKNKSSSIRNIFSNVAVISIKIHLCLIYTVSGLHKLNSKVWFSGVALYYCLAIERFRGTPFNKYLIQNGVLVTIATYSVMFWEVFFSFLVSSKRTKTITLIFGFLMHIGIFIFMMIYDFEIIFIMCYGFFYSDEDLISFWRKCKNAYSTIKRISGRNTFSKKALKEI